MSILSSCLPFLTRIWRKNGFCVLGQGLASPLKGAADDRGLRTKPDFSYDVAGLRVAVYIDGPTHDTPDQRYEDRRITESLKTQATVF